MYVYEYVCICICMYMYMCSVAMSVSEAVERAVRSSHDNHSLATSLQQSEEALQHAQRETLRWKKEVQEEKGRSKQGYVEKLAAERKAAELLVGKARAEVRQ